jgi:N-acetylglucosamine-6-sulfatase
MRGRERASGARARGFVHWFVALVVVAVAVSVDRVPGRELETVASAPARPNIVLILTDDQRWNTLWAMPNVRSMIVDHGVTFSNAYVVNSLCCPSRTTILTGKYSHSTGVWTTVPPYGGWSAFHANHGEGSTAATWLHAAGYRTALVGKYLNGYGSPGHSGYVPRGWDRWVAFAEENGKYYDYDLSVDGTIVHHGSKPSDYSTNVLANQAAGFIRRSRGPLFLYFAPAAPHLPAIPAPGDDDAFPDLPRFTRPNYFEADVSDKPRWVREHPPLTSARASYIASVRRHQVQSLLAVDRAVGRIVSALADTGRLHNTLLVFTSDNGYMWGEHRLTEKGAPYEESVRVPMVVRYDRVTTSARTDGHQVLNLDLAPTFAAAARVDAPGAEGRSLLPLLGNSTTRWRPAFLVEHAQGTDMSLESFVALHTAHRILVLYGSGEREYYDLSADPYELRSRAWDPSVAAIVRNMRQRIHDLIHGSLPPVWNTDPP